MKQKRNGRDSGKVQKQFHCGSLLFFENWTIQQPTWYPANSGDFKKSLKKMLGSLKHLFRILLRALMQAYHSV